MVGIFLESKLKAEVHTEWKLCARSLSSDIFVNMTHTHKNISLIINNSLSLSSDSKEKQNRRHKRLNMIHCAVFVCFMSYLFYEQCNAEYDC